MSIIFEPIGGLGNQLFIYALAKEIQNRSNDNIFFRLSNYKENNKFRFELDTFKDGSRISIVDKIPYGYIYDSRPFHSIVNKYPGLRRLKFPKIFYEKNMQFSSEIYKKIDNFVVRGFFQSWKYFEDSKYEIKNSIRELVSESNWFKSKRNELKARENFTAIHIRGGDYKSTPSIGVLRNSYFKKAVEVLTKLNELYPDPVIFTDDHSMLKDFNLFNLVDKNIIVAPPDSRPIESLILMSMAKSIVTANSTFSWWSAYLSSASTVIAPRPWLQDKHHNDRDLILPNWLTIGRE